jgi:LEA14-like dessication related protein
MGKKAFLISISLVIVLLLLPNTGCAWLKERAAAMKPEVREISHEWGNVTQETIEVITTVKVYNPNPFTLPVKKITGDLNADGIAMGHSESGSLHIAKEIESSIVISTKIDNSKIPVFWTEHLNRNENSEVEIDAGITFDLKVTDFTFPYHLERPLQTNILSILRGIGPETFEAGEPVPVKITLKSLSGFWGEVTQGYTEVNLVAVVHNDNAYPLSLPRMTYDTEVNGIKFASGESEIDQLLPPNSDSTLNGVITLDNQQLADCFVSHIKNGEESTFQVSVSLIFELPGENEVAIPILEESQPFETDILGNKA